MTTWTAYICYPYDPAALALDNDGLLEVTKSGGASVEEIDVQASSYEAAMESAQQVMDEHYDPNGRIVHLEERQGWYF